MKIIKLKESDLERIISRVIFEQTTQIKQRYGVDPAVAPSDYLGKGGELERQNFSRNVLFDNVNYKCLPKSLQGFANYVRIHKGDLMKKLQVDEKTLLLMTKAAMGTIGRETSFGHGTEFTDDAAEFMMNWGMGLIPKAVVGGINLYRDVRGQNKRTMSLGPAQFTPETWKAYGLDEKVGPYEESFNMIKQGLGTIYRINNDYQRALKVGTGTGPSVNPIAQRQGKLKTINGTGNNALDLAIVSHNMANMINKWCETSDPNYAGPCNETTYQPFKDSKPEIKVNVNRNKQILNYFPNKKSGAITSIGYLEEVVKYINKFQCFTI